MENKLSWFPYSRTVLAIFLSSLLVNSSYIASTLLFHEADAQGLQLNVSAADSRFQNHFFGPQIVQVIIDDPGATDPDESTVGLQVKGVSVPRAHLADGLWYSYFAEDNTFGILLDVLTDGFRDNTIAVQSGGTVDSFGNLVSVAIGDSVIIGDTPYTIVRDSTINADPSPVREIDNINDEIFIEVDQNIVFPSLPSPFEESNTSTINPDISLGSNPCASADFNTVGSACDWPFVKLIEVEELDIVSIRGGPVSVELTYDDFEASISSTIDRIGTSYPVNSEIIFSFTDFMYNINPVEEDIVSFILDESTGTSSNIIYKFGRSHDVDFLTDILPVLFRPELNFDTRQLLEIDAEGLSSLLFYEQVDFSTGTVSPVVGGLRIAENARSISSQEFSLNNISPVITMTENDPNTSIFESIDEQQGGRSGIFAGSNDRVASFDYFDIINSASMTFHDGFAAVDREIYDSADRAVFTVTDADLNRRSIVSEQPPASESRAFVKVGNPFPLTNNPALSTEFPTSDNSRHMLKNLLPMQDVTFDPDSIQIASFTTIDDVDSDVKSNQDLIGIVNFLSGDNPATNNGLNALDDEFFVNSDDVVPASPFDTEIVALHFDNIDLEPDDDFDKANAIIINTAIHLKDLNSFEIFRLTKGQILRDATAPAGSSLGATQAFEIDPFLSAVSIYRTTGNNAQTVSNLNTLSGNPTLEVFFPRYNLLQADLGGLNIGLDNSGDMLKSISVQIEAFKDLNNNGKLDSPAEIATSRRSLVDFKPFESADIDGDGTRNVEHLSSSLRGTGSFRVVDLLNFDWDSDGGTVFDGDADDLDDPNGSVLLRLTVVFVAGDIPQEPVNVLDEGVQVAVLDIGGLGSVIIQDSDEPSSIDQIHLTAFENLVYRIQIKEQGSNSNVFTGRMDFFTANQFDTVQKILREVLLQGDPARAWLPNRFIPPDRLAFSYSDTDIVQSARISSATFVYETRDGMIFWDNESYKFGSRAIVTLEDEDLNRRPDAIERYDLPVAGFIFFELGKERVDDTCTADQNGCILSRVDATFMETGTNTGIFEAQVQMPPTIRLKDGTVSPTRQDDLQINYVDTRDRSSITQEFDDITNIRTRLGQLLLDRNVYPQGPRLPPNEPLLGAIMYISIVEGAVNQDPEIREKFDLTATVDFSSVTGNPDDMRDTFEIKIFNGGSIQPVIFSANPQSSFLVGGDAFPILDRNGNQVITALESGPNTGIFELEFMIYCPDSTPLRQFMAEPVCTDTIFDAITEVLGLPPILTYKANSRIEVTFNDPADDSGAPEDVNASAVIQGITAQLGTDKIEYDVGDPVTFFMVEPDFNFDSKAVEMVDFNFVGVTTDKTPVDDVPLGILLNVLSALGSFSSAEAGFRESNVNSGLFGAIAKPGVLDTLVANRGTVIEIVYNDFTSSGGGNPVRIEHDIFLKANTPEIVFDKEEYTPFDEVIVTIVSPDSNVEPFQIDIIRPLVSSSSDRGFRIEMEETDPNSRIFEHDITLTPDKSKFPGDLLVQREDGLTVEFRIDSRTVVTKSVFVNYHIGNVMFEKDVFTIDERAIVRIVDPDENRNPDTIDTVQARIWSTTDRGGLLITLRETGDRTGIFEEFITFTVDEESTGTRLRVSVGDTITMKYTDRTLPAPAALDTDGVFTVEVEELFSSALIGSTVIATERISLTDPEFVSASGAFTQIVEHGKQVIVQSELGNNQQVNQNFVCVIQVKNMDNVTVSLSWISGQIPSGESVRAAQSWIPEIPGTYNVEVFVWESVENPEVLSSIKTLEVEVS